MSWRNPELISCGVFPAALCKNSLWSSGVPLIVIDSRGQFTTLLPSDVIHVITHMIQVPYVLLILKHISSFCFGYLWYWNALYLLVF